MSQIFDLVFHDSHGVGRYQSIREIVWTVHWSGGTPDGREDARWMYVHVASTRAVTPQLRVLREPPKLGVDTAEMRVAQLICEYRQM